MFSNFHDILIVTIKMYAHFDTMFCYIIVYFNRTKSDLHSFLLESTTLAAGEVAGCTSRGGKIY